MILMIIDFHVHVFPENIADKITNAIVARYKVSNVYPCTVASLLDIMSKSKVDFAIAQIFANTPKNVMILNDWASTLTRQFKNIFCFGTVHPDMVDPEVELERMAKLELKGLKLQPTVQRFVPDNSRMFKIYEKACKLNLPILFHAGKERAPIDYVYAKPKSFKHVLASFPKLTVILAHLGGYQMWDETGSLIEFDNAYFDTSCTVGEMPATKLKTLIEQFRIDHVLFGSDFPWFKYEEALDGIKNLDFSNEQKNKIFWGNASSILKIEMPH